MSAITHLLDALARGEPRAAEQLLALVYDELRRMARQMMSQEAPGRTLTPTALVHEAYLRLADGLGGDAWANRRHFFAACAECMRRILVDRARARQADKRGGDRQRLDVELDQLTARYSDAEMLDTDSVLDALADADADSADLVRLHVFGGLSLAESGAVLGMSRASAYRNWAFARAWLRSALSKS